MTEYKGKFSSNIILYNKIYILIVFKENVYLVIYSILYFINLFSMKEDKIKRLVIKNINFKEEIYSVFKSYKIKVALFFSFSILFSVFSIIYICCFNIVYSYTRNEWIKSSIFIFISLEVIINCILTFVKAVLRYMAIKFKSESIFKLSLLFDD